jgi:putative nucleotidyltransferase with HDIG domain
MSWEPLVYIISPEYSERTVLRAQLLGADYNVAAFHSSEEAVPRLVDGVPHIIIVDADHAKDEAGSFPKLMQRLEDTSPLPLLHIRDLDDADYHRDLQREGCDDTLMRPVKSLELLSRVGSLLRNRQLLGQIRIQENFLNSKGIKPVSGNDSVPTILLVEDETAELENIRRLLDGIPCNVIEARTPSDALWHVKRTPPQLVIVDLLFPDLDGLELCRYLKRQEETRYTPLLMLTSVPELDNRIVGMESGPDDYLVKPVNNMEVLTRVRRLLYRNRGHQKLMGNYLLLNRHGFTDPSSGIPRHEFFRYAYPEMVSWSQKAQLPFTVARIRISTEESFLKIASETRSCLRNFDLDFITGDTDISFILPETPADRAQIALSRVLSRAQELGVPPWELRMATVSVGEDGWDTRKIHDLFRIGSQGMVTPKEFTANGEKIVIAGNGSGSKDLVRFLADAGFKQVETLKLEEGKDPGKVKANLVVLQGDLNSVPDLIQRLIPSLPNPDTPILVKYTGAVSNIPPPPIPDSADYIPPGASTSYFIHRVRNSLDLAQLRAGNEEIENFLKRLIRLLEEGDVDVRGHGQQVSNWAVVLGGRLGLASEDLEALRWGGLLHDVGKIFLPGRIVSNEGMLSAEEFTIVKSHARLGYDLCRSFTMLSSSLPIIKHHHERIDGKGYPEGLKGEKIPLLARIVSVVDVYDTLTQRRPYRPAFTGEEAISILRSEAEEGMWDLRITKEFLKMLET